MLLYLCTFLITTTPFKSFYCSAANPYMLVSKKAQNLIFSIIPSIFFPFFYLYSYRIGNIIFCWNYHISLLKRAFLHFLYDWNFPLEVKSSSHRIGMPPYVSKLLLHKLSHCFVVLLYVITALKVKRSNKCFSNKISSC